MRLLSHLSFGICAAIACIGSGLYAQTSVSAAKETPTETRGMPPRASSADYQVQAKAGAYTIAAEFMGHAVPTPEGLYNTEDYVIVEAAIFGAPDAKLRISSGDFALRINGKKAPLPSVSSELVLRSLTDPNWQPPNPPEKTKSSGFNTGGGGDNTPPPPPKMPMELRHVMNQHVQKTAFLEGDRSLPQAGLLFFPHRGKVESIRSIELVYSGAAGEATLNLQP